MRSYAKSIALYERTKKHLAGGVSSNVRYASTPVPLFFERGEGARLYDVDGNVHIDYVLGNGPAILGHAPKPVIDAVARSLAQGQVYAGQHPRETELAERLCRLLPGAEVVRFATSGHRGGADGHAARPRLHRPHQDPEIRGPLSRLERPGLYQRPAAAERGGTGRCAGAGRRLAGHASSVLDDVVVAGWNDLDALTAAFERHPGEIAAVIMEPVMVNGGAIPPRPRLSRGRARSLPRPGALFICDEVITGFPRRPGRRAGALRRHGRSGDLCQGGRRRLSARRWSRAAAMSWTRCSTRA